jgi:hypothetical protein
MENIRNQIYTDIESQFPAIYREEGELFVEFVKEYYKYLDLRLNNFRDARIIRDIDTTYDRFLIYFKEKYLKDFPLPDTVDVRFLVKHIQDLYRRKGTEESLRLLFRIFFDEEIEVFYPSSAILKPSDSVYGSSIYLELKRVETYRDYPLRKGDRIRGSTSKATAFVDELVFLTIDGVIVPVAYLSNVIGTFIADDAVEIYRQGVEGVILPGKIIYGSINQITVSPANRQAGNRVGDILRIRSNLYGKDATCIVTSISEAVTGVIEFAIQNGGWGYSARDQQPNELYISNQVLVLESANSTITELDTISANNSLVVPLNSNSNNAFTETISGIGQVIAYEYPLVYLNTNANNAFDTLPFGGKVELYVNGDLNRPIVTSNISLFNESAKYDVAELNDIETVTFITDLIGDFIEVPLDSSNYGMSGPGQETLNTTLRDAFTPKTLEIGSITKLKVIDNGRDYKNDVKSLLRQPDIIKFDKRDIGIVFDSTDFLLTQGDIITQQIEIEDLTYQTDRVPYTVKAEYLRREGNTFYFRQKSFYDFDNDFPIIIKNNQYNIITIVKDFSELPMGANAHIDGRAKFAIGQVESVKVIDTGFRYRDGEEAELLDVNGNVIATCFLGVKGQGQTEAKWKTTTSFLNDPTKVIPDNFYYQEYSYDVSSLLSAEKYERLVKDMVQVAGTIQFSSPLINSVNDFESNADISIEIYDLSEELIDVEANNIVVGTLSATANNVIIGDLIAIVETLDEEETAKYSDL